jgi:hypothetical protein
MPQVMFQNIFLFCFPLVPLPHPELPICHRLWSKTFFCFVSRWYRSPIPNHSSSRNIWSPWSQAAARFGNSWSPSRSSRSNGGQGPHGRRSHGHDGSSRSTFLMLAGVDVVHRSTISPRAVSSPASILCACVEAPRFPLRSARQDFIRVRRPAISCDSMCLRSIPYSASADLLCRCFLFLKNGSSHCRTCYCAIDKFTCAIKCHDSYEIAISFSYVMQ